MLLKNLRNLFTVLKAPWSLILVLGLLPLSKVSGQEVELNTSALIIAPELKANANAVIREKILDIEILGVKKIKIVKKLVVTVFNESGNKYAQAIEFFDNTIKVRKQQAVIYNGLGRQIDKIKGGDFEDISAISGGDLYTDNRYSYLDYTPTEYPYTLVYTSEVETTETAFINPWYPIAGSYVSVEKSEYRLKNTAQIPLRFKERNLSDLEITTNHSEFDLSYTLTNAPALVSENLSGAMRKRLPEVLVALNSFSLVNVQGFADDWKSFGLWQYTNLIHGLDRLPNETIEEVSALVQDVQDPKEKVKRIYEFVQDRTRYISVQLGIGGWRPYPADQVDKLGYGDCKGLTNYTKALLKSQGIEAYYTVVWAGDNKRDIDPEFASMQGNHVILNVPLDEEELWLECTSQTMPFNFLGDFTDDRNVLVISPEGGKIKKTPAYVNQDNLQEGSGSFSVSETGDFTGEVSFSSKGIQYDQSTSLDGLSNQELKEYYLDYFDAYKNVQLDQFEVENNKEEIQFNEKVRFSAQDYGSLINGKLIFKPNAFNANEYVPKKRKNRKYNFVISRGYKDVDQYTFSVPENMTPDFIPEPVLLETSYGRYNSKITTNEDGSYTYYRAIEIFEGDYPASEYDAYRDFRKKTKKHDNAKVVFINK